MYDDEASEGSGNDLLEEALELYTKAIEHEDENRKAFKDDVAFALLEEQWPEGVRKQRMTDGRPCLTVNKLASMGRQVVNDARKNKPGIIVHPVDDGSDPETAEIFNGIIRNIEQLSNAEVAYNTGLEGAVFGGFGYWRINTQYASDDTFEQDIVIERLSNTLSVVPDCYSQSADSSDWNFCFVTENITKRQFKKQYPKAEQVDFKSDAWKRAGSPWIDGDMIQIAEYWVREPVKSKIVLLSSGETMAMADYEQAAEWLTEEGVTVQAEREVSSHKVTQYIMSGAEILETIPWAGVYIPIVPVYGAEIVLEGKRYFRSLIRGAKDAQQMFNYWRPLSLKTPVPTPTGWSTIGEIEAGDKVFDETGKPATVIGKSPVHLHRDCYRVTFDDGSTIISDGEHPWAIEERAGRLAAGPVWKDRLARTDELTPGKHFIKVPKPLDLPHADLPIDPYVLGVWLGDGASACGRISQSASDVQELRVLIEEAGCVTGEAKKPNGKVPYFTIFGLTTELRKEGVLNKKSIPAKYLRASKTQREALLQGLMDTDGSIDGKGQCSFTSANSDLAQGFAELVRSLGIKAVMCKRVGRIRIWADGRAASEHADAYQFSFTPSQSDTVFRLSRKSSIQKRVRKEHVRRTKRYAIRSVDRVASEPVQCIAIDAPSHLFLAGEGMVPTHNTTSTELVAMAPKTPFIGRKGAFETDAQKWATANTQNWSYIEYDGPEAPQRQPFAGVPAGMIQEALNASDDIKATLGMYDAAIGARSNETSGKAIIARQMESDTATFHFIDNLSRAIRHSGRILIDLIPKVYSVPRVVRILGKDGEPEMKPVNQPVMVEEEDPETGEIREIEKIYELGAGRYDLTVSAGPSFATQRQEAASQMIELIRAYPDAAPVIGDLLVKNLDWPGADEIAERLNKAMGATAGGEQAPNPQLQEASQIVQQQAQAIGQLQQKLQAMEQDKSLEAQKLQIQAFEAETKRMAAMSKPSRLPET